MKVLPTTKNTNAFMVAYLLGMSYEEIEKNYTELYYLTEGLQKLHENKKLRSFRNLQLLRIDLVHGKHVPMYEVGKIEYFYKKGFNPKNAILLEELEKDGVSLGDYHLLTHSSLFCRITSLIETMYQATFLEAGIYNPTVVWSLFCVKNVHDSKSFRKYRKIIDKNIYLYFGANKFFIFNSWRKSAYYRDTMLDSDQNLYHDVSCISGVDNDFNDVIPCKFFLDDSLYIEMETVREEEKKKERNIKNLKNNHVKVKQEKKSCVSELCGIENSTFYVDSDNLNFLQILKLITTTLNRGNKYRLYYDSSSNIQWGIFLHVFDNLEGIEIVHVPRLMNNKSVVDMQIYKDIILNGKDISHVIVSSDSDFFIATHEGFTTQVIYDKDAVSETYLEYLDKEGVKKYELNDTLYGNDEKKQELLEDVLRKLMVIKMIELPIKEWDSTHLRKLLHKDVTEALSDSDIILTSTLTEEIVTDILDNVKVSFERGKLAVQLHEFEYEGVM